VKHPAQAAAHAIEAAKSSANDRGRECLTFRLGREEYAIEILRVQEIRQYEEPNRIPEAPAHVAGVLNLRGVIVPILDLRRKFRLKTADITASTVTIVLALSRGVVGAVVDSVSDVVNLPADAIRPAPEFEGVSQEHITGIGVLGEGAGKRMLILLDVERLLGADSLNLSTQLTAQLQAAA